MFDVVYITNYNACYEYEGKKHPSKYLALRSKSSGKIIAFGVFNKENEELLRIVAESVVIGSKDNMILKHNKVKK